MQDFSALGYLFAAEYARATGVPVGVIEIDGNGQPIGAFLPNSVAEATGSDKWSEQKGYTSRPVQRRCGAVYVQPLYVPV